MCRPACRRTVRACRASRVCLRSGRQPAGLHGPAGTSPGPLPTKVLPLARPGGHEAGAAPKASQCAGLRRRRGPAQPRRRVPGPPALDRAVHRRLAHRRSAGRHARRLHGRACGREVTREAAGTLQSCMAARGRACSWAGGRSATRALRSCTAARARPCAEAGPRGAGGARQSCPAARSWARRRSVELRLACCAGHALPSSSSGLPCTRPTRRREELPDVQAVADLCLGLAAQRQRRREAGRGHGLAGCRHRRSGRLRRRRRSNVAGHWRCGAAAARPCVGVILLPWLMAGVAAAAHATLRLGLDWALGMLPWRQRQSPARNTCNGCLLNALQCIPIQTIAPIIVSPHNAESVKSIYKTCTACY